MSLIYSHLLYLSVPALFNISHSTFILRRNPDLMHEISRTNDSRDKRRHICLHLMFAMIPIRCFIPVKATSACLLYYSQRLDLRMKKRTQRLLNIWSICLYTWDLSHFQHQLGLYKSLFLLLVKSGYRQFKILDVFYAN